MSTPKEISSVEKVAVIGAGTMGHGIAQVSAMAGWTTVLSDVNDDVLAKAKERVAGNLAKGVARGKVTEEEREAALARLSTTTSLEEASDSADVVIEAAPEKIELKQSIFQTVVKAGPGHALLATNTSSLAVEQVAAALPEGARDRVVGMHFFNPVHIMKLVEVIEQPGSAKESVALACALSEKMKKTPIVVRDTPGFASSRLGLVIGLEAMRMVEQGVASAKDIDIAMKLGYGHPMGPLELTDLVGLDVRLAIAEYLAETVGAHFAPPQILRDKVAAGSLGKKSGQGFYAWADGRIAN